MRKSPRFHRSLSWTILVLLVSGTATAGVLFLKPLQAEAAQHAEFVPERFEGFPSAQELQDRFLAGDLQGSHALSESELQSLQIALDDLNEVWHAATTLLHGRMETLVDEAIDRGELEPVGAVRLAPQAGALGGRISVRAGLAYEQIFYPGDDERLDTIELRRSMLRTNAEDVIRVFFQ